MPYRTPIYYRVQEPTFPANIAEHKGFFVGFAENVGHDFTFRVLTADTHKIICRSRVRIAADGINKNVEAVLNTRENVRTPG